MKHKKTGENNILPWKGMCRSFYASHVRQSEEDRNSLAFCGGFHLLAVWKSIGHSVLQVCGSLKKECVGHSVLQVCGSLKKERVGHSVLHVCGSLKKVFVGVFGGWGEESFLQQCGSSSVLLVCVRKFGERER